MKLFSIAFDVAFLALVQSAACTPLKGKFSDLVVFGDSLSDNGNLASYLRPQIPDFPERSSNGKVAAEYVAKRLGIKRLRPSKYLTWFDPSGTNYAVTGARCIPLDEPPLYDGENPAMRIPAQVEKYLASVSDSKGVPRADPNALYMVFGGGNDLLDAMRMKKAGASDDDVSAYVYRAAASCADSTRALIDAGARYVIHVGVANAGDIPRFTLIGDEKFEKDAEYFSITFDIAMESEITKVEDDTGIDVVEVDMFSIVETAAIKRGLQGSEPCTISPYLSGVPEAKPPIAPGAVPFDSCVLPDANGFTFYDEVHPTTTGHRVIARVILKALERTMRYNEDFPNKKEQPQWDYWQD